MTITTYLPWQDREVPLVPEYLPPGYTPAARPPERRPSPVAAEVEEPPAPARPVLLSGVLHTVTGAAGAVVHLHRADYQVLVRGGWTAHGYAWRCTGCRTVSCGYEPSEFGRAITDARTHDCEAPS